MAGLAITGYKYALSTSANNVTYSSYGAYQSAKILLEENRVKMDLLVQELLDKTILYPETFYKDY